MKKTLLILTVWVFSAFVSTPDLFAEEKQTRCGQRKTSKTIKLKGPFTEYKYYPAQELAESMNDRSIKINGIRFTQSNHYDAICMNFEFAGEKRPDRWVKMTMRCKDVHGKTIGRFVQSFSDRRSLLDEIQERPSDKVGMWKKKSDLFSPEANLHGTLKAPNRIGQIHRISVTVEEFFDNKPEDIDQITDGLF